MSCCFLCPTRVRKTRSRLLLWARRASTRKTARFSTVSSPTGETSSSSPLQGLTLVQECHDPSKSKDSKVRSFFGLSKARFGPALQLHSVDGLGRASLAAVPATPTSDGDVDTDTGTDRRRASAREAAQELTSSLMRYLLPEGYPSSVAPNYIGYAKYQSVAMCLSSAAGVLSTQSLFYAMGLGAGSIPFAAALNWVIKDGMGQLGGVLFASLVSRRFDAGMLHHDGLPSSHPVCSLSISFHLLPSLPAPSRPSRTPSLSPTVASFRGRLLMSSPLPTQTQSAGAWYQRLAWIAQILSRS